MDECPCGVGRKVRCCALHIAFCIAATNSVWGEKRCFAGVSRPFGYWGPPPGEPTQPEWRRYALQA